MHKFCFIRYPFVSLFDCIIVSLYYCTYYSEVAKFVKRAAGEKMVQLDQPGEMVRASLAKMGFGLKKTRAEM